MAAHHLRVGYTLRKLRKLLRGSAGAVEGKL